VHSFGLLVVVPLTVPITPSLPTRKVHHELLSSILGRRQLSLKRLRVFLEPLIGSASSTQFLPDLGRLHGQLEIPGVRLFNMLGQLPTLLLCDLRTIQKLNVCHLEVSTLPSTLEELLFFRCWQMMQFLYIWGSLRTRRALPIAQFPDQLPQL
jgi:hypothetical protein